MFQVKNQFLKFVLSDESFRNYGVLFSFFEARYISISLKY